MIAEKGAGTLKYIGVGKDVAARRIQSLSFWQVFRRVSPHVADFYY